MSGKLSDLPLAWPLALTPSDGYIPDFLSPPPAGPEADIADDLAQIRATRPAQVRREIGWMDKPPSGAPKVGELVDTLAAYWERAVEPDWPRIRAFLQADIQHRARLLVERGPAHLFDQLHPMCRWHDDHLTVEMLYEGEVELAGRGLVLVPSAFLWTRPFVMINRPWQPTLIYPARGLGTLWDDGSSDAALAPLMGATRARILAACDAPASTSDLARRLKLTPGAVSQHLRVLRGAGLVSAQRAGREVLYARSTTGDALLGA